MEKNPDRASHETKQYNSHNNFAEPARNDINEILRTRESLSQLTANRLIDFYLTISDSSAILLSNNRIVGQSNTR